MELPKRIVVLSYRTVPFEGLDESTRLVDNVHRERLSLPDGDTSHQEQSKRHSPVNCNMVKTSKKVTMSSSAFEMISYRNTCLSVYGELMVMSITQLTSA